MITITCPFCEERCLLEIASIAASPAWMACECCGVAVELWTAPVADVDLLAA